MKFGVYIYSSFQVIWLQIKMLSNAQLAHRTLWCALQETHLDQLILPFSIIQVHNGTEEKIGSILDIYIVKKVLWGKFYVILSPVCHRFGKT